MRLNLSNSKWIIVAAILVLTLSAAARLWNLGYPDEFVYDEVYYIPAAKVLTGMMPHPGMGAWSVDPLIGRSPDTNFSHPIFGKLLLSLGVRALGDNGWGWRIITVLFGIFTIPMVALIAWQLWRNAMLSLVAMTLFSLDFMPISISRLGILDSLLMFFGLAAMSFALELRKNLDSIKHQIFCGLMLAATISIKENMVTAAFAISLILVTFSPRAPLRQRLQVCCNLALLTGLFYSLAAIYHIKHGFTFFEFFQFRWRSVMLTGGPLAAHRYHSQPYAWLFDAKALWLYFKNVDNGVIGIICWGNPLIWLGFLPASYWIFARYLKQRQWQDGMLLLWFLVLYLPMFYFLWQRGGFIYHHYAALVPMVLIISRSLFDMPKHWRAPLIAIVAASSLLVIILPLLIGIFTSQRIYDLVTRFSGT